jgi:ligand-binding SRPBCC domain-containing protein
MRAHVLETGMLAPTGIRETFAVFEDPYNLARITPPWLNFRITSRERVVIRKGAEITYRIAWLGIPLRWKTVITAYEPPFLFIDEQTSGPYVLWRHTHRFSPEGQGTRVEDRVEYVLPFGLVGRLVHRLVVRRQLERIFAFRQRALAEIWRGPTEPAAT